MNNTKKIKIKLFKKKNVSDVEVKCVNELNIGEKIENINLKKIQKISKEKYHDNIKNNMINFIKNNDNDLEYLNWLRQFNEEDYLQEYVSKTRKNDIYHNIWDSIIREEDDFELIY